jgi:hypothetical protein
MDAALDALMHDEYSSGEYRLKLKSVPVRCLCTRPASSVVIAHARARQRCCTAWLSGFPKPPALGCRRRCCPGVTITLRMRTPCVFVRACVCVCTDGGLLLGLWMCWGGADLASG